MNISELIIDNELQMPSSVSFDSITTSGNVGIGTTSPSQKLHVDGALYLTSNPSNPGNTISASFWNQANVGPTISGLQFVVQTNGTTERLRINNEGNVGIGTNSPQGKLHISSGTSGDCVLILEADTDNNNEADNPAIWFKQDGGTTESSISMDDNRLVFNNNVLTGGGFAFYTGTTDNKGTTSPLTGASEIMTITSSGNVGIGTISPNKTLHVNGHFRCSAFSTADDGYWRSFYVTSGGGGQARLYFRNENNLDTHIAATSYFNFSDDRLKEEEENISNGLEVCMRLSPQIYKKKNTFDSNDVSLWSTHSGFIAQEIYYGVPELRHVVSVGQDANPVENINISPDPKIDPDYSSWGSSEASINYVEIIPYTVSAIQELSKNQTEDNQRITELEAENEALQSEVILLKQQLASITERLTQAGI